jgi:hypothetical protein
MREEKKRDAVICVVRFDIIDMTLPAGTAGTKNLRQKMLDEGDGGRDDRRRGMVRIDAGSGLVESEELSAVCHY